LFNGLWFEYMYVFMYDKDMNDDSFNFISLWLRWWWCSGPPCRKKEGFLC
jgi:hypothetical protein